MTWTETNPMKEKIKFIAAYLDNTDSFRALCSRFNISCKTGYKYIKRYNEKGVDGLKEDSRARHNQPNKVSNDIESNILTLKHKYSDWGAKKLLNYLQQEHPNCSWPARSTVEEILKRNNLVKPSKRRRRVPSYKEPLKLCVAPNDIWSIDYKGQFLLGNQRFCYPLTVTDNFSRYLLAVDGAHQVSGAQAKQVLTRLFLEFGLPSAIRSDNGSPFAANGLAGLSALAVWLIKLGVTPERIRKGHPEENGRHERMHLTLKKETTQPAQWDLKQQQQCFNNFIKHYNEIRPHEGIDFNRPVNLYYGSSKSFPAKVNHVEYDSSFLNKRRIRTNGTMKWHGQELFISETLAGETIGMKPLNEEEWCLYFSFFPLGIFNEKTLKVAKI